MWRACLARLMRARKIVQGGLRKLHMVVLSTTQITAAFLQGMLKDPRSAPAVFQLFPNKKCG